jgi:hypothetical protein
MSYLYCVPDACVVATIVQHCLPFHYGYLSIAIVVPIAVVHDSRMDLDDDNSIVGFPRDDDDWQAMVAANNAVDASAAVVARTATAASLMVTSLQQKTTKRMNTDNRTTLPRNNCRDFHHGDAL